MNRKKATVIIFCGVIIALTVSVICLAANSFSKQYNAKGISSLLCITMDESQPKEYIGELDNYGIYVEKLETDALYCISVSGETLSLREAVTKNMVSVKDWRKKAWNTVKVGDTEILRYENYEIAITDGDCIIRPITE